MPYCGQCCPRNYTEQYYADHPADYSKHPPIFLSQTATVDNHADLCTWPVRRNLVSSKKSLELLA